MNQEKIMKAKMISAIIMFIAAFIGMLTFIGLFYEKSQEVQTTYKMKYAESIGEAAKEIDTYLTKKADYEIRYNMLLSDMGAARTLIFLIDDCSDEQKSINELYFCLTKYPSQMKDRLEELKNALEHIEQNLDKGYDEVNEIVNSIDKLGD